MANSSVILLPGQDAVESHARDRSVLFIKNRLVFPKLLFSCATTPLALRVQLADLLWLRSKFEDYSAAKRESATRATGGGVCVASLNIHTVKISGGVPDQIP